MMSIHLKKLKEMKNNDASNGCGFTKGLEYHNAEISKKVLEKSEVESARIQPDLHKTVLSEVRLSEKERKLVDKWIKELSEDGYTPDDMIAIFREARRKHEDYKQRKSKQR